MDKNWMQLDDRLSDQYINGVDQFLEFAFRHARLINGRIRCPCMTCNNTEVRVRDEVKFHLLRYGMVKNYVTWYYHGEDVFAEVDSSDDDDEDDNDDGMRPMLEEAFGMHNINVEMGGGSFTSNDEPNQTAKKFYDLLRDAEQPLYPGCDHASKLEFLVKLLHLKCLSGWSNNSFNTLLELIRSVFPVSETVPSSYYEARKFIRDLGLDYEKIDACPNDCMLFRKEYANSHECVKCGASRWKMVATHNDSPSKKIPVKTLRYFPLTPRLQRLYMSSKTATDMRWHDEERVKDGLLRHPADSEAWKRLNGLCPSFSSDPRNVRLGLASDGFNPFGTMSIAHSTWPVVVVPYNLPPWKCMKQPYFMLSLLIPGPKAPGNQIDVFLQPLIEELKELWEIGVETYDASKKQNFQLHAALLWTINDFPAYANLSGYSTKGKWACPCCNKDTDSQWLTYGKKFCYMGHRRFLPMNHRWRNNKSRFDGKVERREQPSQLYGHDVLNQLCMLEKENWQGSSETWLKHWKKKSIFFDLPYWKDLLLRHNLDVMHIEKNVCDNVFGTIMNIERKSKDGKKARMDLMELGIRKELHIDKDGKLPPACYTLSSKEKLVLLKFLKEVKVPDGYSSNISRLVNMKERKFSSLKSHDSHILMQRLLPLAIRGILPKEVCNGLIELSNFFREICSRVLVVERLNELELHISETLCKLEQIFLPTFFDVMEHLPVHLPSEARIAGPVQYRWMYPIERYLRTLKSYVRNKSRPEGSIAEGYLAEECLTFCSRYLSGIETKFNRIDRNDDRDGMEPTRGLSVFSKAGRGLGKATQCEIEREELLQARLYVLKNCDEVRPFIEEHKQSLARSLAHSLPQHIDNIHNKDFPSWFENRVTQMHNSEIGVDDNLLSLARGPAHSALSYKGYIVNGFRFHTQDRDKELRTQNSGVVVTGETNSFASARDNSPTLGNVDYYGVLTNIIELQYLGGNRVVLLKCDWRDVYSQGRGIKIDEHGFTSLNFGRSLQTNEPFVLACQAEQVYYVRDMHDPNWYVVQRSQPRDFYDMHVEEGNGDQPYQQKEPLISSCSPQDVSAYEEDFALIRSDIPPEIPCEEGASRQSGKRKRGSGNGKGKKKVRGRGKQKVFECNDDDDE